METSLELPIKRACEEIDSDSGSGLEASKKAKADTQSGEYSSFRTFDEFCDHYGDSLEDPLTKWRESLHILKNKCKIDEIKLYLISEGQEDAAKMIQSFQDDVACSIESNPEFTNKGWILRPNPGPYDNYQRLYVGDFYGNDDIPGYYSIFYNKYSADLAFQELFKELQSSIKWDISASELKRTHDDASMRYNGILSSLFVEIITGEIQFLKKAEQNVKEWVSLCTKFRHEVARSEIRVVCVSELGIEEAGIDGGGIFKDFVENIVEASFDVQYGLFKILSFVVPILDKIPPKFYLVSAYYLTLFPLKETS